MPTYQYRCQSCRNLHEAFQKMSDEPLKECPACGGELKRIISAAGIIFKGSGWHINDYSPSATTSSEQPASESKPAESTEKKAEGGDSTTSSPTESSKVA